MCRLKSNILYPVFLLLVVFSSVGYSVDTGDEPFSHRMMLQHSLDHCIHIVYLIKSGDLTQDEGLDQLEETLDMIKFFGWYWVED